MVNFIIAMLLAMPWVFVPSKGIIDQFRLPQAFIMTLMFLGIIAMSFLYGSRLIYRNKYLFIMSLVVFCNSIFYFFLPWSLLTPNGRIINTSALEPILHIILGLWAVQVMLSNIEKIDMIRIAKALCLSALAVGGFAILQYVGLDPLKAIAKYNCANVVSACLDNPNIVGNYLVLCLPLFFMFNDLRYKLGAAVVLLGVLVTGSHFAMGLAMLGIVVYFISKYRKYKIAWLLLILILLLGFLIIQLCDFGKLSGGMSGRLPIWNAGIEKLKDNLLFGHGIGIWKTLNVWDDKHTIWLSLHNDWLERTVEMGLIWLLSAIALVVNSLRRVSLQDEVNYSYLSMFVVFLVMMFGSFPFETPTIAVLGIISFIGIETT
jgi:O-antigen ligase